MKSFFSSMIRFYRAVLWKLEMVWCKIRYDWWIFFKCRIRYGWWIVRYGGKKRIPREVVFGALARSMQRMEDNMKKAQDSIPLEEMTEEERVNIRELRLKMQQLSHDVSTLKTPEQEEKESSVNVNE